MGSTKDELKQRELFIIKMLRKGHSRKWVASQLEEKYNLAPSTAVNVVNEIGGQLNKSLENFDTLFLMEKLHFLNFL